MTIMNRKTIIAALLLALGSAPAYSQLNSSVNVEGEYEPLVIETERLNTFPQGYKFELPAANLDYEFTGIVANYKPTLFSMGVTGRQTAWPWDRRKGFIDFRLGSYLDSRLHAGVNLLADSVNTLDAELQFRSSSLFRTHGVPDNYTKMPLKRLYDGKLGINYSRVFEDEGLLEAAVGYRLGYFNYYGSTIMKGFLPRGAELEIPTQTLNHFSATAGYRSNPSVIRGWHAEGSVDYLAYRRLYAPLPQTNASAGLSETRLNAGVGYNFPIGDNNALALDATGQFLFYPDRAPEALGITDSRLRNYGVVTVTPAYRFSNRTFTLKAGADLAFSYDAMGKEAGKKFGVFHVAPEVELNYKSASGVGLFLSATGGVMPSTLLLRDHFDRYQMPWLLSTTPIYTPIDGRLGINVGPLAGFSAEIAFRYAVANNIPLGGWYQAFLGAYSESSFPIGYMSLDPYSQSFNIHGMSFTLNLHYSYGTMVELSFDGSYTPQSGKNGIFNGFDRPRWTLSTKAGVRPIKKLLIEVGYDYRGVRNCYSLNPEKDLQAYRLPDLTDLNAQVTYSLLPNLDIYCTGENLLNRRVALLPGLQSEGIVICGGFYLTF